MNENLKDIRNRELKDTVGKKEHGTVYGNLNGAVANHKFVDYPINEKQSLGIYINTLEKRLENNDKVIQVLKKAILENEKRIKSLEKSINKYGLL